MSAERQRNSKRTPLTPFLGLIFPRHPLPIDDILVRDLFTIRHGNRRAKVSRRRVPFEDVLVAGPRVKRARDDDSLRLCRWPGKCGVVVGGGGHGGCEGSLGMAMKKKATRRDVDRVSKQKDGRVAGRVQDLVCLFRRKST